MSENETTGRPANGRSSRKAGRKAILRQRPDTSFALRCHKYARDVVEGRILACGYVRKACKRHLDDLARTGDKAFGYKFDAARTSRICRFIELLPHVKGEWARATAQRSNRIRLEPWQIFITCSIFGWVNKTTGYRRFLEVYIEVARKNAKSTWAAAVGLFCFTSDGEPGAEVYCGATTKKQAMEVFRTAWRMAKKSPEFCDRFGIEVNKESLVIQDDGSKFEPVIGDPGDGASPSCAILDERHEHPHDNLHDTMVTGMGARRQGLTINITTAGTDTEGVCYAQRHDCEKILDGLIEDDSTFAVIFTIDKEDDPKSEVAQRKANPNYGVSVYPEYLQKQLRSALKSPHAMFVYKTKHLCVWGNAPDSYFSMEAWEGCKDTSLSIAEFAGKPCWMGVDLAAKVDLASRVKIFREIRRDKEGRSATHYFLFGTHYAPHDRVIDGDHAHYERWVEAGFLSAIPGPEIQLTQIQQEIEAELSRFDFQCIAFDPWSATQMQQDLALKTKTDVVLTIPQTVLYLSEPMKELNAAMLARRVHHNGDPVLTFGVSCVLAKQDNNENVFPRKLENGKNKIDPVSATLNGLNRAMVNAGPRRSIYETRGLLTV